jgi:hypothetical protein
MKEGKNQRMKKKKKKKLLFTDTKELKNHILSFPAYKSHYYKMTLFERIYLGTQI